MYLRKQLRKAKATKTVDIPPIAKPPADDLVSSGEVPKKKKWWEDIRIIVGAIITLTSFYFAAYNFWFKPDEKIKKGTIESPKLSSHKFTILKEHPGFVFNTKGYHYPLVHGIKIDSLDKMNKRDWAAILLGGYYVMSQIGALYQGVEILNPNYGDCSDSFLALVAKDDRLYVWTKFIDLRTQDEIGEMALNHWTLYKDKYLKYLETDSTFEVIDNQGYVVFSIAFRHRGGSPIVSIAGYFNSPSSVLLLGNHWHPEFHGYDNGDLYQCFRKTDVNWLQNAQKEIAKITSVFK